MIERLDDLEDFRRRRRAAWECNIDYWLNGPLRHVDDVGGYIAGRVAALCRRNIESCPVVIDMGFGNAWLLKELVNSGVRISYVGLDSMEQFVDRAMKTFRHIDAATFLLADVESELD